MIVKFNTILILFLGLFITVSAQHEEEVAEKELSLHVDNRNFFRNNEFFSDLTSGYTLLGFHITPTVKYQVKDKLTVKGGLHLLKYAGREDFNKVDPYFSLRYHFNPAFSMTLGSYSVKDRHRMINPLFSVERKINAYVQNGLNFLYDNEKFYGNLWLDWDQFIYRNDSFREKFTIGGAFNQKLLSNESNVNLSIPLEFLLRHKGGQINESELPTSSVFNYASGVNLDYTFAKRFIRKVGISFISMGYKDLSHKNIRLYKNGTALYPVAEVESQFSRIKLGYWDGQKFYAPLGHPMFQNIAHDDPMHGKKNHRMITADFRYKRQLLNGVDICVTWENYVDVISGDWNYTYALSVSFKEDFFLKKLP
ncbi:MAG: hypothetical protein ACOCPM_05035 [Bacteroidales bacterium]